MLRDTQATFVMEIQDADTLLPVVLPGFAFSLLDIDGIDVMETYRITGWTTAQYDDGTDEAYFSETDLNCAGFINNGETCLFAESTKAGTGCDDPTDPFDLITVTCGSEPADQ